jgi:SH3 domain protein
MKKVMRSHLQPTNFKSVFFICLAFSLILIADISLAQSWYIKPTAEIPLRRGQGSDYKILAIVPDGTAVTIVEEEESWARVTTRDGKEGWILKRYLTQDQPLDQLVESLKKENQALKDKIAEVQAKNEEVSAFNDALHNTLETNKKQLTTTTDKYEKLVKDTSDVIALRNNLNQTAQTATKLQQELGEITAENKRLKASQNIKWFLAGGGTLIFGCIAGMLLSRSKKRKSSLY